MANSVKDGTEPAKKPSGEAVLQAERLDFVDLVPENRPRAQSMKGFDDCYTDIVDYIIRCTHKIWDERDVGLIYSHYTHDCVVYSATGTSYTREEVVQNTIQRMFMLPERRGMATQVIWNGNDEDGFYTSHLVTGTGRHTQPGIYGKPTGRTFVARTIADCMIYQNKIYREWLVVDSMAQVKQIGLDPQAYAANLAKAYFDKGLLAVDTGENGRLIGQYPPESKPDLAIANNDLEREVLQWLHDIHNRRMFGGIKTAYAPTVQYHGPLMKELYGHAAVIHQTVGLYAAIPDGFFMPQHICSQPSDEGGHKVAVRWVIEGHHLGWGVMEEIGGPTGKRVQVMGMTHFHIRDGKVVDEWTNYDEMSVLMQIKLAQMADRDSAVLDEA